MKQMTATIDRRDLRAYHARLQDFLLQAINTDQLRFRIAKNSVILYPPDGSQPMTVYARNGDRQIRTLQKWYLEHVYVEPEPAPPEALEELAKTVNDPVEHPEREKKSVSLQEAPVTEALQPPESEDRPPVAPPVWVPYRRSDGNPHPNIETDGTYYRCTLCEGTDHPMLSDNPRSIGGHQRIYHTEGAVQDLYSPEARAKALDTRRSAQVKGKVTEAVSILNEILGVQSDTKKAAELEAKVTSLQEENKALTKRVEEAEAKLALIREATGL